MITNIILVYIVIFVSELQTPQYGTRLTCWPGCKNHTADHILFKF